MSPRVVHWLKEIALMAAIAGGVFLVFDAIQASKQRGGGGALPVGIEAPAFELLPAGGGPAVKLADLNGAPLILTFWATYCGPCKAELPDLEQVHRAAGGRYRVVTLSSERRSTVQRFLSEHADYTFPVLLDRDGSVFDAYGVESVPTTVIIDRDGRIVHDFSGRADPEILAEHMAKLSGPAP